MSEPLDQVMYLPRGRLRQYSITSRAKSTKHLKSKFEKLLVWRTAAARSVAQHEAHVAETHLVATADAHRAVHRLLVDVTAVGRVEVGQLEDSVAAHQAGVRARDARVRYHHVVVLAASQRNLVLEQAVLGGHRVNRLEQAKPRLMRRHRGRRRRRGSRNGTRLRGGPGGHRRARGGT